MDPGIKISLPLNLPLNLNYGTREGVTGQQLIDAFDAIPKIPGLLKRIFRLVRVHGNDRYYNVGLCSNQSWDAEFLLAAKSYSGVASTEIQREESSYAYLYITCEYPVTVSKEEDPGRHERQRQSIDEIVREALDFQTRFEDSLRQVIAKSPAPTTASTKG